MSGPVGALVAMLNMASKIACRPNPAARTIVKLATRSLASSKTNGGDATKQPSLSPTTVKPANDQVSTTGQQPAELVDIPELQPLMPMFRHETMDPVQDRQVRITRPSKNVMQSGTAYTQGWKIEFDSKKRWENLLTGWTSSADPLSNLSMSFPTKESAIDYCERNQLNWFVDEQPTRQTRRKSYADNFSWNKRTRLGSK